MMRYKTTAIIIIFLLNAMLSVAQKYVYDFGNNISNIDKALKDEILHNNKADIVHIGDSHVQSGFFSEIIRDSFQKKYGNAGRGITCMHGLYGSNDANDISTKSIKGRFVGATTSRQNLKNPISLSAIEVNAQSNSPISISLKSKYDSFKNLVVFRSKNSSPLICDNYNTINISHNNNVYWVTDTIVLRNKTNSLQLYSDNKLSERTYAAIYMYNDNKGVVINSIGVNGATFEHFNNIDYFKEVSKLSPKFLIISLGTNDGYTNRFDVIKFRNNLETFSQHIKKVFHDISVVFTTPPPSCLRQQYKYKRKRRIKYINNPNIKVISSEIINCAKKHGFAVVDIFSALGGEKSISGLLNKGKLGKDRVHYTVEGYREHGRIVSKSIGL